VAGAGPVHELAPGVAERITATEAPTGLFAIVRSRTVADDVLATASFVLVADRLADPGNLGTVVRSAEACGVEVVVATPGTVDPLNPKVVRAAAGALFHVPVLQAPLDAVRAAGLRLVGTSSHHGTSHTAFAWTGRLAIVLGSEAHGLRDDAPVDDWVRIGHRGRAESLNVAMAATVLAFEAARQREGG
jgi:TrmH family RNA methyltransferase